jgi:mannose-6-phosphate isomerase
MDVNSPARAEPRLQRALTQRLMTLEPQYRERVWGGRRLRVSDVPIGEAWIAMGESRVAAGSLAGRTVSELATEFGAELLGRTVFARFGGRFPLLAKFLDAADWLSVQVHPNDEQARRMVGPDEFGKTEAWYFVEAAPHARILLGVKRSTDPTALAAAIREGRVIEVAQEIAIREGDAVLIPAGTLHALGPGLLLFEIQQASDTTYRAYDWGRPQTAARKLHIEESVAVTTTDGPQPTMAPRIDSWAGTADAVQCPYFDMDLVRAAREPLPLDTGARSFQILATIDGTAEVSSGSERVRLGRFETLLVAASTGAYEIVAADGQTTATLLRVAVPS